MLAEAKIDSDVDLNAGVALPKSGPPDGCDVENKFLAPAVDVLPKIDPEEAGVLAPNRDGAAVFLLSGEVCIVSSLAVNGFEGFEPPSDWPKVKDLLVAVDAEVEPNMEPLGADVAGVDWKIDELDVGPLVKDDPKRLLLVV